MILSDIRLPVGDGIRLLQWAAGENFLHIPFVVMTEFASYPDAVRAIKLGAVDYLHKPVYREPLLELLHEILKSPVTSRRNSPRLQRNSRRIREVERIARKVAPSDMSVLILGPNGSGKESVAQTIYEYSLRKDKPFVAVNCGGIPKELGASEFFGYVKGAFTGADADLPDILRRHAVVLFFWMRLVPCPMNCRHRCSGYYKNAYTIRSVAGECMKRMFVS